MKAIGQSNKDHWCSSVWVAPKNDPTGGSETLIFIACFLYGCALAFAPTMPLSSSARGVTSPSLADDLNCQLDLDDDFLLVNQPSVVSSLALSSIHGGPGSARARGESSGVSTQGFFLGGGVGWCTATGFKCAGEAIIFVASQGCSHH